jgi:hypothetical protein
VNVTPAICLRGCMGSGDLCLSCALRSGCLMSCEQEEQEHN